MNSQKIEIHAAKEEIASFFICKSFKKITIMTAQNIPTVETQMLIRKPVSEVFKAFIYPGVTTNFWFTKSSGPLEIGKTITWE